MLLSQTLTPLGCTVNVPYTTSYACFLFIFALFFSGSLYAYMRWSFGPNRTETGPNRPCVFLILAPNWLTDLGLMLHSPMGDGLRWERGRVKEDLDLLFWGSNSRLSRLQVISEGSTAQIPQGDSRSDSAGMRLGHVPVHHFQVTFCSCVCVPRSGLV